MKKIIALLLTLILIAGSTGCSNQSPSEPATSDAGQETDNNEQTENTNETENTKLESYFEIYYNDGLLGALNYFDNNYDNFDEDSRNEFSNALIEELKKRGNKYKVFQEIEREAIPVPPVLKYVDGLYPNIFNSEKNTFNINTFDDELKNIARELEKDDVFSLCKSYWATEGYIEDFGFIAIVNKEVYEIISDRFLEDADSYIENVSSYTDHIGNADSVFKSDEKYPIVLVENNEKFDLFSDINKTTLYIPVKIVDEPISQIPEDNTTKDDTATTNENSAESNDASTASATQEVPENKVIKNYEGPGIELLGQKEYDFKYSEEVKESIHGKDESLAVFGTIYDVEIGRIMLYTEGWYEGLQEYDTLSNVIIDLKDCPYTDEMSSYMVYVSFYDEDLNYHVVGFAGETDSKDTFVSSLDIKEIELKSGSPSKVGFESTEHAILSSIDGGDDKFSAVFLVDNYEEYMKPETNQLFFPLDVMLTDYYEELNVCTIPLWVSSNMYDVEVVKSNYGEEIETFSDRKNIKAGTWLICSGILNGDGEAYDIKFKLEDGTEKAILITTDESDEAETINGYVVRIH